MAELVERYRGQVFGLCFRMLGHRQDAEDMAQETFVRVLRSLATWDPDRDFEPWLLAIAANRCRSMMALKSRRYPPRRLVGDWPDDSADITAAQILAEEVQRALVYLRQEYAQAFVLFHEHELSYAEIAQMMECPLGTVKTWVHRARRGLIQQLREREVIEEPRDAVRKV